MAKSYRKTIIRIAIDHADEASLKAVCQKRGMTQISLVSRMVKWLAHQDSEVQSDILNTEARELVGAQDHQTAEEAGVVPLIG